MRIEVVEPATTRELRRSVLRPTLPVGAALPGDDRPDAVHIGAVVDGRVLSTCFVFVEPCPWAPQVTPAWHLRQMATAPDVRGRGLGGAVLEAALAHARAAGGRALWAAVREPAVAFYARHGLERHGEIFVDPQHPIPHQHMWRRFDLGSGNLGGSPSRLCP
jgi:GNAT superfamily N-acetyltransferase